VRKNRRHQETFSVMAWVFCLSVGKYLRIPTYVHNTYINVIQRIRLMDQIQTSRFEPSHPSTQLLPLPHHLNSIHESWHPACSGRIYYYYQCYFRNKFNFQFTFFNFLDCLSRNYEWHLDGFNISNLHT